MKYKTLEYKITILSSLLEDHTQKQVETIFFNDWVGKSNIFANEINDKIYAKPYGLSQNQQIADAGKVDEIFKNTLPVISKIMNEIHSIKFDDRSWNILIGHWYLSFLNGIWYLYRLSNNILEDYSIEQLQINSVPEKIIASDTILEAKRDFKDKIKFDYALKAVWKILDTNVEIVEIPHVDKDTKKNNNNIRDKDKSSMILSKEIRRRLYKFLNCLSRKTDALILGSGLNTLQEIYLNFKFKQVPKNQIYSDFKLKPIDHKLRAQLTAKLNFPNQESIYKIIEKLFYSYLPNIYLESFEELDRNLKKQKWPKSPKFIYTSVYFYENEVFKYYVSKNIEKAKYVVGQHGNGYFTSIAYDILPPIELDTANLFLSWGNSKSSSKVKPIFITKKIKFIKNKQTKEQILYLLTAPAWENTRFDGLFLYRKYIKNNIKIINKLAALYPNQIVVRLWQGIDDLGTSDFITENLSNTVKIDFGSSKFSDVRDLYRLAIFSFDSTGFLESLSSNLPTIELLTEGNSFLNLEAQMNYEYLKKVGIVHYEAESLYKFLNKNFDINNWWYSQQTQLAVRNFCENYAVPQTKGDVYKLFKTIEKG